MQLLSLPGDGFSGSACSSSLHCHWGFTSHGLHRHGHHHGNRHGNHCHRHCHRHCLCERCLGCVSMRHRPSFFLLDNLSSLATRGFRFGSSKKINRILLLPPKVTQSPSANRWSLAIVVSFEGSVALLKLHKYFRLVSYICCTSPSPAAGAQQADICVFFCFLHLFVCFSVSVLFACLFVCLLVCLFVC